MNGLPIAEAAEILGYTIRHVNHLILQGDIKAKRVGTRVYLISESSLVAYKKKRDVREETRGRPPKGQTKETAGV